MSQTRRSLSRMLGIGIASLALAAALAPSPASGAGNLLPNPAFEDSVLEPVAELHYVHPQPVLPTGWAFEGSAGLFDHSPNGNHTPGGRRMAAISIPASGNRSICAPEVGCNENPANLVKDTADLAYSIGPAWRNAVPVPVSPGGVYGLSVWVSGDLVTQNEGAVTAVRWLDSTGAPVGLSRGPERRSTAFNPIGGAWNQISGAVQAPSGATQAVVLLGHSHDLWIGQVRFDDVSFG